MLKFTQNSNKNLLRFLKNSIVRPKYQIKQKIPFQPQYQFSFAQNNEEKSNFNLEQQQLNPLYNINLQQQQQIFQMDAQNNNNETPANNTQGIPPNNENENNNNNENDNNNNENNNNNNNKDDDSVGKSLTPLQSVPLRTYKKVLTEEEKLLKQEKHILFSSQQPILPYTSVPCQLRTGNLQEIAHPLSYFLLNEDGEIYLVGIELENKVESELKKTLQENQEKDENEPEKIEKVPQQTNSSLNMEITPKKMSSRVQIIEIQVNDQGIFAITIPYKDKKPTHQQEQFNLDSEFELIKSSVKNIKKSVSYEKIEIFQDLDIERLNFREFSVEQLDQVIFQIIAGIQKLYARYMKESLNVLIQSLIESKSIITRVQLIRHHLESLEDVLEIVNKNFKAADENMIRMHTQARARMSMEYIKQTYFGGQKEQGGFMNPQGAGSQNQQNQQQFNQSAQQQQSPIQRYQEQLQLIEDGPSREKVAKEIQRFALLDKHSSEYHKVNTYLDEVFSIPWKKYSEPFWDIEYAQKKLDEQIYGLEKVKKRIIEMIAVNQLKNTNSKDSKGFIVLLYGPPGIGKTSIAKAVASSLKKEHRFITFAGVSDPYFIKGHRRTYVDSQPGVFIKELIKADTMNPVFILDEIDKVSRSSMGADPYYTLLEILNPDENNNFMDHYMDIKVDFSNVIFILTANEILHMLEPLRNRLELIEIPAYIEEEKLQIGKNFLMPRIFEQTGMNPDLIKYNNNTLSQIINNWCYHESGVRQFSRAIENISRKFAVELIQKYPKLIQQSQQTQQAQEDIIDISETKTEEEAFEKASEKSSSNDEINNKNVVNNSSSKEEIIIDQTQPEAKQQQKQKQPKKEEQQQKQELKVNQILTDQAIQQLDIAPLDLTQNDSFDLLKKYLGTPPHDTELEKRSHRDFPPGTVNVLTVAGFVGHALTVECVFDYTQIDKKGQFSSSGNLKTVLKESLQIAKINAYKYLNKEQIEFLSDKNFHIHFMQGATPKDGPSAGTAITTALLSLVLNKKVPSKVGMTGEISLNGEVCKIGGLQSKIIGCKSVQISTIIAPYANMNEALEFPQQLLDGITIHFVKEYDQIHELLFEEKDAISIPGIITMKNGKIQSLMQSQQNINPDISSISQSI